MTDERTRPAPGTDTNEVDSDEPRRTAPVEDEIARENAGEQDTNPLLREGPDAPDAADIEDPDEQL